MPATFSLSEKKIWPTLGQTLEELSRKKTHSRDTLGADALPRTLDRMNGMWRSGAESPTQALFGGIVAGKDMDWVLSGNVVPRDAVLQRTDAQRGLLTMHLGGGLLLDSEA